MAVIRDAAQAIAILEDGELVENLSDEAKRVRKLLYEAAGPKGKAKGSITLKLSFEVSGSSCEIEASVDVKVPKPKRGTSFFFVNQEGELLTEHPKQTSLFNGPKEVNRTA